jgi:hypothetical protein
MGTSKDMNWPWSLRHEGGIQPASYFASNHGTQGMTEEGIWHIIAETALRKRITDLSNQSLPIGNRLGVDAALMAR